jgi:hypothetical protein
MFGVWLCAHSLYSANSPIRAFAPAGFGAIDLLFEDDQVVCVADLKTGVPGA